MTSNSIDWDNGAESTSLLIGNTSCFTARV